MFSGNILIFETAGPLTIVKVKANKVETNKTEPIILINLSKTENFPIKRIKAHTKNVDMVTIKGFNPISDKENRLSIKPEVTAPTAAETKNMEPSVTIK